MATDAAIIAALNTATALAITAVQMVALLDRAIASAVTDATSGPYLVSLGADGVTASYATLDQMRAARAYYREQQVIDAGGLVTAVAEF